jgi:hypothetical protein
MPLYFFARCIFFLGKGCFTAHLKNFCKLSMCGRNNRRIFILFFAKDMSQLYYKYQLLIYIAHFKYAKPLRRSIPERDLAFFPFL